MQYCKIYLYDLIECSKYQCSTGNWNIRFFKYLTKSNTYILIKRQIFTEPAYNDNFVDRMLIWINKLAVHKNSTKRFPSFSHASSYFMYAAVLKPIGAIEYIISSCRGEIKWSFLMAPLGFGTLMDRLFSSQILCLNQCWAIQSSILLTWISFSLSMDK